jgi:hypothetical protein
VAVIVVVTGGRDYRAFHLLSAELDAISEKDRIRFLVHRIDVAIDTLAAVVPTYWRECTTSNEVSLHS